MASQNSEAVRVRIPVLQQEKSYKHWRNAILMWSLVTDVEPEKQALVVALNLSGRERELALNIDSAELNKKTGLMTLLNLLDERIQRLDAYRSFQKLDNLRKSPLQSMRVYLDSFKIFYKIADALGSSIPDKILAYKLLNGSDLSQERQEKILETTEVISVARISAALLSAENWPGTKAFPKTTANGSKQLQVICTQPNQPQHLRTQTSSLSNTSSKFSFSAFNCQTNAASPHSTVKVTELAASASTKDSSRNFFPGFSFSDTSLKNSPNKKQEIKFSPDPFSSLKSSLKKTNEETRTKGRAKETSTPTATPIAPSFGAAATAAEASTPQVVQTQAIDSTTKEMLVTKKEAGSWNCPTCYSPNLATDLLCPCCSTPNPNAPKTGASKTNVLACQTGSKFCFGTSSGQKSSTTSSYRVIFGSTPSTTSFTPPKEHPGARTNAVRSLFPAETDTTVESNLFVALTPSDQSNGIFAVQTPNPPVVPMKSNETKPPSSSYGAHSNEYKPLPLATSDVTKIKTAFLKESGKFLLNPASTDPTTQDNAKDIPVSSATDDEVVFVCELVPTHDQRKRAEKLLLPATFFLHENNPLPQGFDENIEDEKEDKILKFIEDRDSGKLELKEKTTTTATTTASSGFGDTTKTNAVKFADSSTTKEGWVFGGATQPASTFGSVGAASFGSLSSGVQNLGFTNDPSFQFPGAGKVMFVPQITEEGDDPASFKCDVQFKPVLEELPPLIEVKTGEEGEEIVFKERCKLYRYDKVAKAWKERGVGEINILRNDEYKLHRVVMRRDQVLKVCTNHVINETTDPELHLGSTNSCSYFVIDYSESKIPTPEKIAIRFKREELCKMYMDKISEIKHLQES